jgi:hypothetical protein
MPFNRAPVVDGRKRRGGQQERHDSSEGMTSGVTRYDHGGVQTFGDSMRMLRDVPALHRQWEPNMCL